MEPKKPHELSTIPLQAQYKLRADSIVSEVVAAHIVPADMHVLSDVAGTMNNAYLIGHDTPQYVLLMQKDPSESESLKWINQELNSIGFFERNSYAFRTPSEQAAIQKKLLALGIRCPDVLAFNDNQKYIFEEFLPGLLYKDFFNQPNTDRLTNVIDRYFTDIKRANSQGMVMGNRWGPNEVVMDDNSLGYFDFKYGYHGPTAKEFELSQALYYTSARVAKGVSPEIAKTVLERYLSRSFLGDVYEHTATINFVRRHANYFMAHGMEDEGGPQPWMLDSLP